MNESILRFITLYFLLIYTTLYADKLTGKVVSVTDGDTIKVLTKNKTLHKVRLNCIDAPEKSQAFGKKSKNNLSKLVAGKTVDVHYKKKDRYRRILGTVYINSYDINKKQLLDGYAWVYKRYCNKPDYYNAEKIAKSKKLGLWYDKNPIPPWEYRHKK